MAQMRPPGHLRPRPLYGVKLPSPRVTATAACDPEQTSAPCWISLSRTQQLFRRLPDASSTSVVRQPSGGSHHWNRGYMQTSGQFKQLGEGAKEARVL
jgi:hypothetical protein